MNTFILTNAPAAETNSEVRTNSIISAALGRLAQSFVVPDGAISQGPSAIVATSAGDPTSGDFHNAVENDYNNRIHSSEVRSYDVILRRSPMAASIRDRPDRPLYEIDQSLSHVGNARFSIMLSMRWNDQQRVDKANTTAANHDDNVAGSIIRVLYDECNGRILVPIKEVCTCSDDDDDDDDVYFGDVGNNAKGIEMMKDALAVLRSPSLSARDSSAPSTPVGEPSSSICSKRGKRSSSARLVDNTCIHVSPTGGSKSDATKSSKRRRRSSLKPSSYGTGGMAAQETPVSSASPSSSCAEHVHFAVPVAPSEVTSADVIVPTINEATFIHPDSGIGNNRLRVMARMVSSRYFEAVSSSDNENARSIVEEVVRQVKTHRGKEGIRGRFLDTTYDGDDSEDHDNLYVEVPHKIAINAVHSFLDEVAGIRTSATATLKSQRRSSSSRKNEGKCSSKKSSSAKLLRGVPIPAYLMPSNIASLRRNAAEDMRKKKAKKVTTTCGRNVHHGGAKGFSSTLCDSQIVKVQDRFRSMAEDSAGGVDVANLPPLKIQSSFPSAQSPNSGGGAAADSSLRGIPDLNRGHLKQSQARAA
jgi:hypothetical protein